MRFVLAFISFFMLILSYIQLPQKFYLFLILIFFGFSFLFIFRDRGFFRFCLKNKLVILIFLVIIISYFNTNNPNVSIQVKLLDILNWTICFLYFLNYVKFCLETNRNPFSPVVNGLIVFICLNLLIYFIFGNIRSTTPDIENVLFRLLTGQETFKANFLLGSLSINHNAMLIAFLSPLIFQYSSKLLKRFYLIIVLFALILLDNRMSILAILMALVLFYPLKIIRLSRVTKLIIILIPSFVMLILAVLPLVVSTIGLDFFSRNSEELITANSRTFIWVSVIEILKELNFQTIFGSGDYGNLAYKQFTDYLSIFVNYEDSEVKTVHNTYLQLILDKGYLFLFIFYFFLVKYVNMLFKNRNSKFFQTFIISFMIFLFCGTTEVIFGSYFIPITFFLLIMYVVISNINSRNTVKYEI